MDICNIAERREMNIVIVGHVDHGKSTVIGRLLADTHSLPQGKLEQIKELCRRTSKPFEYAFLLDALKDERAQGITIDTARCFFKTEKRKYIIIDAPGHIEFLKNMISGASRAQAALLVIDANEGIKENSRRHGYMLSMLGIKQVSVLVNKLDLIPEESRESVYNSIVGEYGEFLEKIGMKPSSYIPVSAVEGWNIVENSESVPWYKGATVLETLDSFNELPAADGLPVRMWVQDVYKFTNDKDDRRIIAGTLSSGTVNVGDEIMFLPSGKKTTVKSIEAFNEPVKTQVTSGYATGFCMTEQIYVKRGELMTKIGEEAPVTGSRVKASVFWLGKDPLVTGKSYKIKMGCAQVGCKIEKILGVLDAATLDNTVKEQVNRHEVAQCIIHFDRPLAFDVTGAVEDTVRFVIVDDYEISGGGIVTDCVGDSDADRKILKRNIKWVKSEVTREQREKFYSQKAQLVVISGNVSDDKKDVARQTEKMLLENGRIAYYLGMANLLYGVNSDIKSERSMESEQERGEHIRRLGELANIMLDAGNILIVTASELTEEELDTLRHTVSNDNIITVWYGNRDAATADFDYCFDGNAAEKIFDLIEK